MRQQLLQLQEVKRAVAQASNGQSKKSERPGGRRSETKEGESQSTLSKTPSQFDAKGQKEVIGHTQGQSFKKKTSAEIAGDVKQARQEAPEAIDRQRIPKDASDSAKGYFENLGVQKEKDKKTGNNP